jgi:hypothetical protein
VRFFDLRQVLHEYFMIELQQRLRWQSKIRMAVELIIELQQGRDFILVSTQQLVDLLINITICIGGYY